MQREWNDHFCCVGSFFETRRCQSGLLRRASTQDFLNRAFVAFEHSEAKPFIQTINEVEKSRRRCFSVCKLISVDLLIEAINDLHCSFSEQSLCLTNYRCEHFCECHARNSLRTWCVRVRSLTLLLIELLFRLRAVPKKRRTNTVLGTLFAYLLFGYWRREVRGITLWAHTKNCQATIGHFLRL